MLTKDGINIENKEGIEFLRTQMMQCLEQMRVCVTTMISNGKDGIQRVSNSYDRLDPENMEKSKTILSNILFFIGSIFTPEITPSKWFGKQSISQEKKDLIKDTRSASLRYIEFENDLIKGASQVVLVLTNAVAAISKSDDSLIELIDAITQNYPKKMTPIYEWVSMFNAFKSCGYMSEETYSACWSLVHSDKLNPYDSFIRLCSDYQNKYGDKQKGRG